MLRLARWGQQRALGKSLLLGEPQGLGVAREPSLSAGELDKINLLWEVS